MKFHFIIFTIFLSFQTTFAINILTASKNGNYYNLVKNVPKCDYNLTPIETRGSIENIKRVIQSKGPTYAIVQGDVLNFFKKILSVNLLKKIRYIQKFSNYNEVVYIIKNKQVNKDLTKLSVKELEKLSIDKKISVGPIGSGSSITGFNILNNLQLTHTITFQKKEIALDSLLNKNLFLIIYVAKFDSIHKKPALWIEKIFKNFPHHLTLLDIEVHDPQYKQKIKYKKNNLLVIPTYFISTDSNKSRTQKVFQCLDY